MVKRRPAEGWIAPIASGVRFRGAFTAVNTQCFVAKTASYSRFDAERASAAGYASGFKAPHVLHDKTVVKFLLT
jgi:hypothetical protein